MKNLHLVAYLFFIAVLVTGIYRVEKFAGQTRTYMCRFVGNLEQRRDASDAYLQDVLHGRRPIIPGLQIADLQQSLDAQNATLASFQGLDCDGK